MMRVLLLMSVVMFSQSPVRILDIYAKDRNDPQFVQQMQLLHADPKGLKERDLVIKQHFHQPAFKITLTGKDGGEKYKSSKVLELSMLYGMIDAMPMRKEEMAKKKSPAPR